MKFLTPLTAGVLLRRYKRFLADVRLEDGSVLTLHCPNTGSMKNCAEPGSRVWFSDSGNPRRKYRHTLELVEAAPGEMVGINTSRANAMVREALEAEAVREVAGYRELRAEVRYGGENSRVDFLLRDHPGRPGQDCYLEVKNVTLGVGDGLGLFPDAVTERGSRHLRELMAIRAAGQRAVLFFCVQHSGVGRVAPAREIDPAYAQSLAEAAEAGVEVVAYRAAMSAEEVILTEPLPVILPPR